VSADDFMKGALTMAASVIALFFLRFWRSTSDRLFLYFSVAFAMLAAHWAMAAGHATLVGNEHLLRFAAFVLIAYAVIHKNRANKRGAIRGSKATPR
jgi:hypothetical protein